MVSCWGDSTRVRSLPDASPAGVPAESPSAAHPVARSSEAVCAARDEAPRVRKTDSAVASGVRESVTRRRRLSQAP